FTQECAYGMCSSNNICNYPFSGGNLCNYCSENKQIDIIPAKNGIHCCSTYRPSLLVLIIILFTVYGLVLSIAKYLNFSGWLCNSITFLQINSVAFFSYPGLYVLPFFKVSWDLFDGVCLFKNSSALHKIGFSFAAIIYLVVIGYSDITLKLIIKFYGPIKNFFKRNHNKNFNYSAPPKFISNIAPYRNDKMFKMASQWRLPKFIGWDLIIASKFSLLTVLSITLLFKSKVYLVSILVIQLVYIISYLVFKPSNRNILHQTNVLLNLFQLILFIVSNSTIFLKTNPYYQGYIITLLVFTSLFVYLFFYY
ncbi:hypothetical protein DICPUDRAFT_8893, partial [Dictyostelium purpureum]